jgi:hypothetical protein
VRSLDDGKLADVAPTLLALMQIPQPREMTGHSLLSGIAGRPFWRCRVPLPQPLRDDSRAGRHALILPKTGEYSRFRRLKTPQSLASLRPARSAKASQ